MNRLRQLTVLESFIATNVAFTLDSASKASLKTQLALTAGDVTGVQPLDATLTALSSKTLSGTGNIVLKSYADAGDAAVAAAAQPLNGNLTAIAALTTTSYGRGFLVMAGAPDARSALALTSAAIGDAAGLVSGTIDLARLPALASGVQVVSSSATIAGLSGGEQTAIVSAGAVVTLTDGTRWVWNGSGSKVLEASYIQLADITPEWSVIANRPAALTSIAGLTTTADRGIYTTASNVYATFVLTAAARDLLDDPDAASQRATLSVLIGSTPGTGNTFSGPSTGNGTLSGSWNTGFGNGALVNLTIGNYNTAVGYQAGMALATSEQSTYLGFQAGSQATGGYNSGFGVASLQHVSGSNNSGLGIYSLAAVSSGDNNTGVGYAAGNAITTGSNNTFIGKSADAGSAGLTFATAIGAGAVVSTSNTVELGRHDGSDKVNIRGYLTVGGPGGGTAILSEALGNPFLEFSDYSNSHQFRIQQLWNEALVDFVANGTRVMTIDNATGALSVGVDSATPLYLHRSTAGATLQIKLQNGSAFPVYVGLTGTSTLFLQGGASVACYNGGTTIWDSTGDTFNVYRASNFTGKVTALAATGSAFIELDPRGTWRHDNIGSYFGYQPDIRFVDSAGNNQGNIGYQENDDCLFIGHNSSGLKLQTYGASLSTNTDLLLIAPTTVQLGNSVNGHPLWQANILYSWVNLFKDYTDGSNYSSLRISTPSTEVKFTIDELGDGVGTMTGYGFDRKVTLRGGDCSIEIDPLGTYLHDNVGSWYGYQPNIRFVDSWGNHRFAIGFQQNDGSMSLRCQGGLLQIFEYGAYFTSNNETRINGSGNVQLNYQDTHRAIADAAGFAVYNAAQVQARVGGVIKDHLSTVSNTHTDGTFDTVITKTIAANQLNATGEALLARCAIDLVGDEGGLAHRYLKVYFAGQVVGEVAGYTASDCSAYLETLIVRTGADTARVVTSSNSPGLVDSGTGFNVAQSYFLTGLDFTATNIFKVDARAMGTGAGAGDINAILAKITWLPAAS